MRLAVVVQTDFPRTDWELREVLARAPLLNDCRGQILCSTVLYAGTLAVVLIIQHTGKVETLSAVIEVGLLEKIGIMFDPGRRPVVERESFSHGSYCCNTNDGIRCRGIPCTGGSHDLYVPDL